VRWWHRMLEVRACAEWMLCAAYNGLFGVRLWSWCRNNVYLQSTQREILRFPAESNSLYGIWIDSKETSSIQVY